MMNGVANAIRFFVYSNIFIALCASAYTAKTALLLYGNNGRLQVTITVFSATLLFYCFHRINKSKFLTAHENKEERNNWMSYHKEIYYALIAISSIILLFQLFYMPLRAWLVFIPVGLLGLGYTFPIIPARNGWKRMRDIYWLKTVWIAVAFSWLTTFLPVIINHPVSSLLTPPVLFIFFRAILFVFPICVPFDIRDMQFDQLKEVHTLPVTVGVKKSIYISIILLILFICLVCLQFFYFALPGTSAIALLCSAVLTIILLPLAKTQRPALFFPLLYDGAMLVQWIFIFVFKHI
jgi:4-hydroxybenzoate polyprenyltransferase